MEIYRTVTFTDHTPSGNIQTGVEYPIVNIDGVNVIVDSEGRYHNEPQGTLSLYIYPRCYSIDGVDDNHEKIKWGV